MTRYEYIMDGLTKLDDDDMKDIWNAYCGENNDIDDLIYSMWEFDDDFSNMSPTEIADKVYGSDFNTNHNYYRHTLYGLESSDFVDDWIDIEKVAEYIDNNSTTFGNRDIEEIFDNWESEENEE